MTEPPVAPPEIKVPHWSPATTRITYWWQAFETLYQSFIWSGAATGVVFLLIVEWSHATHHPLHMRQFKADYLTAVTLFVALTFLLSYSTYTAPDRGIQARLRDLAASTRLQLTRRANGLAGEWIWTRFPSVSMGIQLHTGDNCWALTSDRDPTALLMVTHTPRSQVQGWYRGRTSRPEVAVLAFFRQAPPADNALAHIDTNALSALGLKTEQTAHGVCVSAIQFCHWRKGKYALDLITVDRLAQLLKLVGMSG